MTWGIKITARLLAGAIAGFVVGVIAAINVGLLIGVDYEHTADHLFSADLKGLLITAVVLAGPLGGMWITRPRRLNTLGEDAGQRVK